MILFSGRYSQVGTSRSAQDNLESTRRRRPDPFINLVVRLSLFMYTMSQMALEYDFVQDYIDLRIETSIVLAAN